VLSESARKSAAQHCISDTNNSHLATVHHYTEAKERSPMDRLPLHFPPFNTLPFTPASPGRFIPVLLVGTTRRKLSSEEGTVLVDAGHFGREYNSKEGVESFQHHSPFYSLDFFLGPQYSSQNPEHVFLSHTVIFLKHVI